MFGVVTSAPTTADRVPGDSIRNRRTPRQLDDQHLSIADTIWLRRFKTRTSKPGCAALVLSVRLLRSLVRRPGQRFGNVNSVNS